MGPVVLRVDPPPPSPSPPHFPDPLLFSPVVRRQQDGGFFKGPPYPGYPFLMLPELGAPYLSNGALSPGGARTVSVTPVSPRGAAHATERGRIWGLVPLWLVDPFQALLLW